MSRKQNATYSVSNLATFFSENGIIMDTMALLALDFDACEQQSICSSLKIF